VTDATPGDAVTQTKEPEVYPDRQAPDHPTAADQIDGNTVYVLVNGAWSGSLHTRENCTRLKRADSEVQPRDADTFPEAWAKWCPVCGPTEGDG
jgi:hypothetical protein